MTIAPEGWLVPLLIMSMLEGNAYGGQIKRRVEELGYGPSRPGTMYRTLRIMEKEGLVVSDGEDAEVLLSRWRFEPTEAGEAYLEFWAHSLAQYKEDTERFLRIHESIAGSGQPHRAVEVLEGGKNGH